MWWEQTKQYALDAHSNMAAMTPEPWVFGYVVPVMLAVLLMALIAYMYRKDQGGTTTNRGKGDMPRHWTRLEKRKQLLEDKFVDMVEELRYKGLITRAEKSDYYHRFAKAFDLPGLLPTEVGKLKAAVKRRRHTNGKLNPTIPGDPPPRVERKARKPVNRHNKISQLISVSKEA